MRAALLIFFLTACTPGLHWTIDEANDIFKPKGNNDRNFTQGLQVSADRDDGTVNRRWYARQIFYTPAHKRLRNPIPTERPYAGSLSAGYTKTEYGDAFSASRTDFEFGLVGPYSFAEPTQKGIHKVLGQLYPMGWDHQISTEPIFRYGKRTERLLQKYLVGIKGYDLGNMFTQGYSGLRIQTGQFRHLQMWPRIKRPAEFEVNIFTEVKNRVVAHNIFLDGNSFGSSRRVEKYPVVFEWSVGVDTTIQGCLVRYTYTKMTAEYLTGDRASFGEIQIRW